MSDFPASPATPGQGQDESPLETAAKSGGYLGLYLDLRAAGHPKEKAFFAAWSAAPRSKRQPKTEEQVSALVGISTRTLRKWKSQEWWRENRVDEIGMSILLEELDEIDRAMAQLAKTAKGPTGVASKKLYYDELHRRRNSLRPAPDMTIDITFNRSLQKIYDDSPDSTAAALESA